MTTFTHQLLARKTSTSEVWLRIFKPQCYGARRYVALGLRRNHFHSTRRKVRHHV